VRHGERIHDSAICPWQFSRACALRVDSLTPPIALPPAQSSTTELPHSTSKTMALISAKTILTSLSLFHITLGFFFLTSPITIADQALVYIMGEAMGLVRLHPNT
jgi:hypothetical protein